MIVEFKLNSDQLRRAREYVEVKKKMDAEELGGKDAQPKWFHHYCGNLLGWNSEMRSGFNKNQLLELVYRNDDGWVMRYEGERHPFKYDGALGTVIDILGPKWQQVRWLTYDTSDRRLRWYETTDDWIDRAGQFNDFLNSPRHRELPERFQELRACLEEIQRGVPDRRLWASYKPDVVKNAKLFQRKISGDWYPTPRKAA